MPVFAQTVQPMVSLPPVAIKLVFRGKSTELLFVRGYSRRSRLPGRQAGRLSSGTIGSGSTDGEGVGQHRQPVALELIGLHRLSGCNFVPFNIGGATPADVFVEGFFE